MAYVGACLETLPRYSKVQFVRNGQEQYCMQGDQNTATWKASTSCKQKSKFHWLSVILLRSRQHAS